MDDEIESLLVEVRANTQGFAQDMEAMRSSLDGTLVGGFERAGSVLETGLTSAIRRGGLGFDDLKRVALRTMDEIAAQAVQSGLGSILGTGGGGGGGGGGLTGSLVGALFGLPGRATGGPVSPGSAYVVGERGPELFVPTSAGRVEAQPGGSPRDVRVAIRLTIPRGSDSPTALRRSTRQLASAVRRVLDS
ncbi:tail tape measure protein [Altererythrobacter sp. CC-YST694]|uniref:tail tape measure protein n=1 Tax=Altererythrobacter sp. CC-YST694 TaxID=2755038 RepID=UPI001D00BE1E|nr:tail tape measure protein [Altererythrobacter sp. CC-YST694]MCB5425231.1 tail tape measure protein [Altererythrobacter sp. CC-YST694]